MLLRNVLKPVLSCREVTGQTVEECFACAREAATQLRQGWLRVVGAPDYKALSVPKIRFYSNDDEVRRGQAQMRCGLRAGWRDGSERLCQVTDEPQLVIISGILRQDPSQVRFAQDDSMVDTLATDRSDQSFGEAILPRRAWGNGLVAGAHGP